MKDRHYKGSRKNLSKSPNLEEFRPPLPKDIEEEVLTFYGNPQPEGGRKDPWKDWSISIKGDKLREISPSLFFHKYMLYPEKENKGRFLKAFCEAYKLPVEIIDAARSRLQGIIESLKKQGYEISSTEKVEVIWRMIVGLGSASPLETNITLDRIYGYPYIPSSAIKGTTRAYAFQKIAGAIGLRPLSLKERKEKSKRKERTPFEKLDAFLEESDEKKQRELWKSLSEDTFVKEWKIDLSKLDEKEIENFRMVFGTTGSIGKVIFFDASPECPPVLELDIMTPHHLEYYKGDRKSPDGGENPKPIPFLAVGKGSKFNFYIASKDKKLLLWAESCLREALEDLGIGAKTRVGYGEMKATVSEL